MSRQFALQWDDLLTVEVLKVHDRMLKCHVRTAPHLSHLVEVRVIEGPSRYLGRTIILPYDNYEAESRAPPDSGEIVSVIPSTWVRDSANIAATNKKTRGKHRAFFVQNFL